MRRSDDRDKVVDLRIHIDLDFGCSGTFSVFTFSALLLFTFYFFRPTHCSPISTPRRMFLTTYSGKGKGKEREGKEREGNGREGKGK